MATSLPQDILRVALSARGVIELGHTRLRLSNLIFGVDDLGVDDPRVPSCELADRRVHVFNISMFFGNILADRVWS